MVTQIVEGQFKLGSKTARSNEELVMTYRQNIRTYGFDSRTLLYPDDSLHKAKLDQYCIILSKLLINNDTLLDIGCGYGSLLERLKEPLATCQYTGIDIVPEFIANAHERAGLNENACSTHGREKVKFYHMDLEEYQQQEDWCVLLGVVNSVPEPEKLVQLAWSKCRKGLVVDFNDTRSVRPTRYNQFDIELQKSLLQEQGASFVKEYRDENYVWTILVAYR